MEKHKKFSLFFFLHFQKGAVPFVNSVNNHPEGIVYLFGSVGGSLPRQGCVLSVSFLFGDNAVNKMYVQYLRDFG